MDDRKTEVTQGERFEFAKNWSEFLSILDEDRIVDVEQSLKEMLEIGDLTGKSFLNIGPGSVLSMALWLFFRGRKA